VDPSVFPRIAGRERQGNHDNEAFVLKYMGGLADDMNFASVKDIAQAVAAIQDRCPVRLEIYTMPWYKERAEKELGRMAGVVVLDLVPSEKYAEALCSADALLLAYNFDAETLRYVGLSLANKMPECLASGVPLLAYGPESVATIAYLQKAGCAQMVTVRDQRILRNAIQELVKDQSRRNELAERAQHYVSENLTKDSVQAAFLSVISNAALHARGTTNRAKDWTLATTLAKPRSIISKSASDFGNGYSATGRRELAGAIDSDGEEGGGLRRANSLYRNGNYLDAAKLYVSLFETRPLSVYRQNALMCGMKLGWLSDQQDAQQFERVKAKLA
jgi:hypothetical protein